jgi:hypothetical protein
MATRTRTPCSISLNNAFFPQAKPTEQRLASTRFLSHCSAGFTHFETGVERGRKSVSAQRERMFNAMRRYNTNITESTV